MGVIDKEQKGIIKDLIICGDEKLQGLLDNFSPTSKDELFGKRAYLIVFTL
jgi:hypothetical protein